jgi:hypothetical protein
MKAGGNQRLRALLDQYEAPKELLSLDLFKSKLLAFHRACLKAEVSNSSPPEHVNIEEAFEPVDQGVTPNKDTSYYAVGSHSHEPKEKSKPEQLFSFLGAAMGKAKYIAIDTKNKVRDSDFTQKAKVMGGKAADAIKDTASKVVTKGGEIATSVKAKGSEAAKSETAQNIKNVEKSAHSHEQTVFFQLESESRHFDSALSAETSRKLQEIERARLMIEEWIAEMRDEADRMRSGMEANALEDAEQRERVEVDSLDRAAAELESQRDRQLSYEAAVKGQEMERQNQLLMNMSRE